MFSFEVLVTQLSKYPPLKESWPLLKTNLIALFQGCYLPLLVEICLVVKEKTFSLNFCLTLLYFSLITVPERFYFLIMHCVHSLFVYCEFTLHSACAHHVYRFLTMRLPFSYPLSYVCTIHSQTFANTQYILYAFCSR